jgi:hypothetical protein
MNAFVPDGMHRPPNVKPNIVSGCRAPLFAGLTTFDLIQLVDRVPGANEKIIAVRQVVTAGGPAANAADRRAAPGTLGGARRGNT